MDGPSAPRTIRTSPGKFDLSHRNDCYGGGTRVKNQVAEPIVAIVGALLLAGSFDARSILLTLLVSIWALRLGSFLFVRVRRRGIDERFDAIKPRLPGS